MILVSGAGIAGLTLANALEQLGMDYQLFERESHVQAAGAGIVLHDNALHVLGALGLADDLPGTALHSMQIGDKKALQNLNFHKNTGTPAHAIHRQELMQRLLQNIPSERILTGSAALRAQQNSSQVELQLEHQTAKGSLLIVADGTSSQLHAQADMQNSGQWCWRAVVPYTGDQHHASEYWTGRHRLGLIPVGDKRAYVFHVMSAATHEHSAEHLAWIQQQDLQALDFTQAHWLSHPLQQRKIQWGEGRIIAIGDAAHAMTPNMGLGAATAMEDAWQLAELLRVSSDYSELLATFKSLRHRRVRNIQRQSWIIGEIAHWQRKPLRMLRDVFTRLTPSHMLTRNQANLMRDFTKLMPS